MKIVVAYLVLFLTSMTVRSQADTLTNSFEPIYKRTNPGLAYQYDNVRQTHNYSDNWDFDRDGKKDKLLFIGTGGAHLYYFLRIVLSSDNKIRDYPSINLDMPLLASSDELKQAGYNLLKMHTQFAVFDTGGDVTSYIYLRLDKQTSAAGKKWLRKHRIAARDILITFPKGEIRFNSYSPRLKRQSK